MPSIEQFKLDTEELLEDIKVFKATDYNSDVRLLAQLASLMSVVVSIVVPQTQAVKLIVGGLSLMSKVIKKYASKKNT
jgi:hypothetical protein